MRNFCLSKKLIRQSLLSLGLFCTTSGVLHAQLYISAGATLTLDANQTISVQDADWHNAGTLHMGTGSTIRLQGTQDQNITTGGSAF